MKFWIPVVLSFFSFATYGSQQCKEHFYSYMAFNDFPQLKAQYFPTMNSKLRQELEDNVEKTSFAVDTIGEIGLEKYIDLALQGAAPDTLFLFGSEISLMDLAVMQKANNSLKDKLYNSNYFLSSVGVKALIRTLPVQQALDEIKKYSFEDLNEIKIAEGDKQYSVSNYWLAIGKASAIMLASEMGLIEIPSNLYKYDSVDLDSLNFEQIAVISNLMDFDLYKQNFTDSIAFNLSKKVDKANLSSLYSDYSLATLCVSDFVNVKPEEVLFAVSEEELNAKLASVSLSLKDDVENILPKLDSAILQEYALKYKEYEAYKTVGFDQVEEFSNATNESIIEFNQEGNTFNEVNAILHDRVWEDYSVRFRPMKLAFLFINNDTSELRQSLLKNADRIKTSLYNGKNISYEVALYHNDLEQLKWFIKNFSMPVSKTGLSLSDSLLLRAFYFEEVIERYNNLADMGLLSPPDSKLFKTFKEHSPDRAIYKSLIERIEKDMN